jgi:DNA-damage-inducible protein J
MAAPTSMLQVSVEDEIREKATVALRAKGLLLSDAVRLFLLRVAIDPAFPLELEVPNAETRAAMAEAERIVRTRRARFVTADELFDDLETTSGK